MKKIDLLKLIESMEDEAEVLDVLKDHEEIKSLAKDFDVNNITLEDFKKILQDNDTVKGYYQSTLDSGISKGVSSFEKNFTENKLPKIIEDELKKKSNEGLTEDQIKIKEFEKKFEIMEKEKAKIELAAKYTKTLKEKELDTELIDFVISDNEEIINEKIGRLETIIKNNVSSDVQKALKGGEYVPPKGTTTEIKNPWKAGQINLTEQARILKENSALASTLKASANK
jgi:hypothetical protein